MSQNRAETQCSECGRFIGSWERCPFCRHFNPKRPIVRLIKYSSPFLAILGIVFLSVLGKIYGRPEVMVADLDRKANFAQVQLCGRVSDAPRFHAADTSGKGSSSFEFELDDDTGLIRVRCYEDTYEEMLKQGKVPGFGDRVTLIGNYQYRAKRQFVILGAAEDLQIEREKPGLATAIQSVVAGDEGGSFIGRRVRVTGRVADQIPDTYDLVWRLEDPDGHSLPLRVSRDILNAHGTKAADGMIQRLQPDQYVTCQGTLRMSRSRNDRKPELIPAGPSDVSASDEETWRSENRGR